MKSEKLRMTDTERQKVMKIDIQVDTKFNLRSWLGFNLIKLACKILPFKASVDLNDKFIVQLLQDIEKWSIKEVHEIPDSIYKRMKFVIPERK
jgi:hypothetical protein